MNARDRKLLRDAAQLIDNGAEALKAASTIRRIARGRAPQLKWGTAGDRRAYERETRIARRLRDLGHGISWKAGR